MVLAYLVLSLLLTVKRIELLWERALYKCKLLLLLLLGKSKKKIQRNKRLKRTLFIRKNISFLENLNVFRSHSCFRLFSKKKKEKKFNFNIFLLSLIPGSPVFRSLVWLEV